jgi:serine protease Do
MISRLLSWIGIAVIAGLTGAICAFALVPPTVAIPPTLPERQPVVLSKTSVVRPPRLPVIAVSIVSARSLRAVEGGSSVADADVVGVATVLTSDGWMVTDRAVFESVSDPMVLLPGGVALPVLTSVTDAETHLTFFQVAAKELDAIAFGDSAALAPGATLFRTLPEHQIASIVLVQAHDRPRLDARDVIRQSNAVAERLVLANAVGREEVGGGLVTENGTLVGILVAPQKNQPTTRVALPIEPVARALRDVVKTGAIHRPSIGVSTIDLSELAERAGETVGAFGARVVAVESQRSAALAGILVGDRIIAVGGDALDGSRLLSDLVASYRIGETVTVTYVRNGLTTTVPLLVQEQVTTKKK